MYSKTLHGFVVLKWNGQRFQFHFGFLFRLFVIATITEFSIDTFGLHSQFLTHYLVFLGLFQAKYFIEKTPENKVKSTILKNHIKLLSVVSLVCPYLL